MKRIAFIIFLSVTFVNSLFAQVPQEMIGFATEENGCYSILKSDIDSIVYSDYDMDSVSYAPNKMTQVIYTKRGTDCHYQISNILEELAITQMKDS